MNPAVGTCGDGICERDESVDSCPADCVPCGIISADGGVIDDGDLCFVGGGDPQYLRKVATAGHDGDLVWTHTTADPDVANSATWTMYFAEAGKYRVEAYTAAAFAKSKQAKYVVRATGTEATVVIDQTAVADGWQVVGEYQFAKGGDQRVFVGDNTGEDAAGNVQLAFDGIRLTRLDPRPRPDDEGSCQTGVSSAWLGGLLVMGLVLVRKRRGGRIATPHGTSKQARN